MNKASAVWFDSTYLRIGTAIVGLLLAYAFGSRALDTGSYWEYLFTLILLLGSIKIFTQTFIRNHGQYK